MTRHHHHLLQLISTREARARPPKIGVVGVGPAVPGRRGRPPGTVRSRLPKRPGRPPKPKSVSAISNGLKRRPGRPPKLQSQPTVIPFAAPAPSLDASVAPTVPVGSPRPRGRPRKNATAVPGVGAPAPPITVPVMRQGRPPKLPVGRPKNSTGRPVGRPKGAIAATSAQKVANEDLKRKLEYFQSKVKESLGVLKPYFNHESPVTAIAAIQELEYCQLWTLKLQ
ncbi:AT hook, DNA-binding motif [Sesbania bispinosa]|nr:AT hook, DNA-binding motif [Sesbania bispinosa]